LEARTWGLPASSIKFSFEVRTSADGFAALVELRFALTHLIICDLRMPNMNGFALLSVVRRRFPHIPSSLSVEST